MRVQKSDLRRNASLAEQNRGQKVWSAIKSNVLETPLIRISIRKEQDRGRL